MFKRIWQKKSQLVIGIMVVLFACVSWLSLASIRQLQGNARVINYVGIVRGATQRLIKKELRGDQDDTLLAWLESIVTELITGKGPNGLIVLNDKTYLDNMTQVQKSWNRIKDEITNVRNGEDNRTLYDLSEQYFVLVNNTVSSAESFSESQVNRSTKILLTVNGIFVLLLIVGLSYYIRTLALRRRAELLGRIAYIDPLTTLSNRASCEREMSLLASNPPEGDVIAFMFDMNNLKKVNDEFGHKGGDKIIAEFGRILKLTGEGFGFVGRYGGDEFLALLRNADESKADLFIAQINEKVVSYNILHMSALEKISFAVGHFKANLRDMSIEDMVNEADKRMYIRKRQMKENRD